MGRVQDRRKVINHPAVLAIQNYTSQDAVLEAYKSLTRVYYPDRLGPSAPPVLKEEYKAFSQILDAAKDNPLTQPKSKFDGKLRAAGMMVVVPARPQV